MKNNMLAVFFPGIGYHNDKPLLYYSRKIVKELGYEEVCVEYHDMPGKVRGDAQKMREAVEIAYAQTEEFLSKIDFDKYERIVFVGKSIGTVVAARYANEHNIAAKLVLYTPVEATFSFVNGDSIAFIGDADPWSELDEVKRLASEKKVSLSIFHACNHSLECDNVEENINILSTVMKRTEEYLSKD